MERSRRDNFKFKHMVQAVLVFILGLNAIALGYLLLASNSIFASMTAAKISAMLDHAEAVMSSSPTEAMPDSPSQSTMASTDIANKAMGPVQPATDDIVAPSPVLTMLAVEPISTTGACFAIEGLKTDLQTQSAKALIATSPLRSKAWTVDVPYPAVYAGGVEAENLAQARKISQNLAAKGIEPLSMSAKFISISQSDSEASARALAKTALASDPALVAKAVLISAAGEKRSLVALSRSDSEAQFAASIPSRLSGASLAASPCPPAAIDAEPASAKTTR